MEPMDDTDRAQLIIDTFRQRTHEIQEQLLAERISHEITKRELAAARQAHGNTDVS